MPYAGYLNKFPGVTEEYVLNFEIDTYVQRIGRTGRIGELYRLLKNETILFVHIFMCTVCTCRTFAV